MTSRERWLKNITKMAKDIRITLWNANGILKRKNELQVVLDIQNIDICLIAETHLTNQKYIAIKGCITYMTLHPENTARGGSAVIIKNCIKHIEENSMKPTEYKQQL